MRILLVEDDSALADAVCSYLLAKAFVVDVAPSLADARGALLSVQYAAVLLDLHLGDGDGLSLLPQIRALPERPIVIVLTARDQVTDRIRGLDAGADDYLIKPFDFGELLARLRALLRRGPIERPPVIAIGDLRIDADTRVVTHAGAEIELTAREYDVLVFLARHPGRVVSRSELLDEIWSDYEGSPNIIDVYVGYLRKKLGRALIRTVRGSGFVLEPW